MLLGKFISRHASWWWPDFWNINSAYFWGLPSQKLNVWYIHLDLVNFYGKCSKIIPDIECLGFLGCSFTHLTDVIFVERFFVSHFFLQLKWIWAMGTWWLMIMILSTAGPLRHTCLLPFLWWAHSHYHFLGMNSNARICHKHTPILSLL